MCASHTFLSGSHKHLCACESGGSRVLETVGDPVIGRYKVKHTVTLALLSLVFLKLRIAQPVTQVMYHFAADKCVCTRLDAAG